VAEDEAVRPFILKEALFDAKHPVPVRGGGAPARAHFRPSTNWREACAYAEYRVFAALTQQSPGAPVRHARVVLRRTSSDAGSEAVVCTVTVAFEDSESMKIRTTGDHAYAAINRAVDRLKLARSADLPGGRGYNPRAS
jgi:hypothetical protein